jgi:hypothetical protein
MLLVLAACLASFIVRNGWHLLQSRLRPSSLVLGALLVLAIPLGLTIGPHPMYYAPAAAIGALITGRAIAVAPLQPTWLVASVVILSVLEMRPALTDFISDVRESVNVDRWTGVQVHQSAVRLSSLLERAHLTGHVMTLFPTVALDSNPVRREFASGPFFFRSADQYPASFVADLNAVGPATLDATFASAPPVAILAGFGDFPFKWNPPMDQALADYANRHRYRLIASDWNVGGYRHVHVWLRSDDRVHAAQGEVRPNLPR